jgi:methionine biosynthesis protein MetW
MKAYAFDEHGKKYKLGRTLQEFRPEYSLIIPLVLPGSSVLDVGCGDGVLGKKLLDKHCDVFGFDLDSTGVKEAKRKGIKAKVWDANQKFPYKSRSFDVVICNTVLEFIDKPDFVISEMFRLSKKSVIVSFPNFGFWLYRIQMLSGRFPRLSLFGHTWWNTRQTRFFSLNDFFELPSLKGKRPERIIGIDWKNRKVSLLSKWFPNFFSRACILVFTKK